MPSLDARFAALLDAHADVPWRIARAYTRTPADREDLYQEMLLHTWRALPAFRGDASERTWLTRIALNVALGAVRTRDRRATVEAPAAVEAARADARGPAADTAHTDALDRLYAAIRTLPEVDRALVLLALDERPHAEIADVLGLSVSNVAVRLHRTRARLADRLADPLPTS
ncbi:MAG: sigma-70 family RNA polymerase sigma factor [Bacteroidota bacterium]